MIIEINEEIKIHLVGAHYADIKTALCCIIML